MQTSQPLKIKTSPFRTPKTPNQIFEEKFINKWFLRNWKISVRWNKILKWNCTQIHRRNLWFFAVFDKQYVVCSFWSNTKLMMSLKLDKYFFRMCFKNVVSLLFTPSNLIQSTMFKPYSLFGFWKNFSWNSSLFSKPMIAGKEHG